MRRILPLAACVFLLASCVAPEPLNVAAQRAEYQAITVDWLRYVEADATLTADQKAARAEAAAAQDLRIRKLEEAGK